MRAAWAAITISLALMLTGCSESAPPVMPDVVGKQLDVALSDVKRAGFSREVEVVGGGVLGVIDESNWTVCEQVPAAGDLIDKPRVVVDRECGDATPAPSPSPTAEARQSPAPIPSTEASAPATPESASCVTTKLSWDETCKFGQTAIYADTVRSGEVKLEITVGAPVEFELSDDYHIVYDLPPGRVNVYFPITIKNLSPEINSDDIMIHTQATNAQQGEHDGIREVSDGEVEGFPSFKGLANGQSVSVKEGWSMETLDGVEYTIRIDGLAGYSVTFTR